jgi:alanine racemase
LMHAGADLFAVANVTEAAALRELGPGWPILILSPLLPEEDGTLAEGDLAATISSLEEVERFEAVGRAAGRKLPVHLKIDTGMGRAGVWHEEAARVSHGIARAKYLQLAGVYTHFASPDDDPKFTAQQRARFLAVLARCPEIDVPRLFVHADNSAGITTLPEASPFNAVRIGLLQFGVPPPGRAPVPAVQTEPVFSFHTRVGLVKSLPCGTTISYGRTHRLDRDATVAVLCAGYADGVPRATSNRGHVLIQGRRCPILGRVTMDQTVVDVSALSGVTPGEAVVLVGRQQGAEITLSEFSQAAETVPWETLTSVTKRVPRIYRTALGV